MLIFHQFWRAFSYEKLCQTLDCTFNATESYWKYTWALYPPLPLPSVPTALIYKDVTLIYKDVKESQSEKMYFEIYRPVAFFFYLSIYIYLSIYLYLYICIYCIYVCIYIYVGIYIYICVCVCMYVYIYIRKSIGALSFVFS